MPYFKPGQKVILVRGERDIADYLYEVVDQMPRGIVIISRSGYERETRKFFELVVPVGDIIIAEETGWELLPSDLGRSDIQLGDQFFTDSTWQDSHPNYSNLGNYFPMRRRIQE